MMKCQDSSYVVDQPQPVKNDSKPVWDMVIEDMKQRNEVGIQKYNVPLQVNNGRDALVDLYQELLDATVYTRQFMEERKQKMNVDMGFVFDMVDSYIGGLTQELNDKTITEEEFKHKQEVLKQFKTTLHNFIKEANKL